MQETYSHKRSEGKLALAPETSESSQMRPDLRKHRIR